jgi:hypothetical protein
LPLKQADLTEGQLKKKSFLRFQNLFALERNLIFKKVATLKPVVLKIVLRKLSSFF